MIQIDDKHLLMIEPTCTPAAQPLIDDYTRKLAAAWRARATNPDGSRGWHDCTGNGCNAISDSTDHVVGPNRLVTNSLCIHYVAYHRADVPPSELSKIAAWGIIGVDPTPAELRGGYIVDGNEEAEVRWKELARASR